MTQDNSESGPSSPKKGGLLSPLATPLVATKDVAANILHKAGDGTKTILNKAGDGLNKIADATGLSERDHHHDGIDDDLAGTVPLGLPPFQLEALADGFQEVLIQQNLVQDRPGAGIGSKVISKCFTGKDAVDVLLALVQDQSGLVEVTRNQAIQVGREMQHQFHFFSHVKHKHTRNNLQDSAEELYHFEHNLPMQVYSMKKQYPSVWDRATLLENRVTTGDHKVLLKQHHDCFLAKEAVDALMEVKLVRSRAEAVHLIRKMNEKVNCCRMVDHPGNDGTNFRDDNTLFRFVPKEERHPRTRSKSPARSKSPRRTGSKEGGGIPLRRQKTAEGGVPGERPSPIARARSDERGRSCSPTKDKAYFQDRVAGLRHKLDEARQEKAAAAAAAAKK